MNEENENAQPEARVQISVTFGSYGVDEGGGVTLRWKAPESELAYVAQTILFVGVEALAAIRYVDEDSQQRRSIKLGKVVFKRLIVNEKGDAQVLLRSDTRSLVLKLEQLGQLINRSMDLVLKEIKAQNEESET